MWQKRFDAAIMTRLENKKSFHAQFNFEEPTSSVLSVFFVARRNADSFSGGWGYRPE
jgi:hypothetical protein